MSSIFRQGVPCHKERTCHKDRRVGPCGDADDKRQYKISGSGTAKKEDRGEDEKYGKRGRDGTREGFGNTAIDHLGVWLASLPLCQVLADPIKHHNRIMH